MLDDTTLDELDIFLNSGTILESDEDNCIVQSLLDAITIEKFFLRITDDFYVVNFGESKFTSPIKEKLEKLKEKGIIKDYMISDSIFNEIDKIYFEVYGEYQPEVMSVCSPKLLKINYNKKRLEIYNSIINKEYTLYGNDVLCDYIIKNLQELIFSGFDTQIFLKWMNIDKKYHFNDPFILIKALYGSDGRIVDKMHQYMERYMTENMLTEFLFLKGSGNKISNKRVVFNKSDGHVFLDGILVMKLKPNQTSYRFLEKLYDNYGEIIDYEALKSYTRKGAKGGEVKERYCHKIKGQFPGILRDLIVAKGLGYTLDDSII